ncbi:hypothetical protein BPAE_0022g00020 [Botrytis paeoniae]|uniref:Uncharacterized protein n=1 Tax=Botrytis paeoniae TaxID=278948 RepID=A0A4Z1G0G3_9HELO|nr:hypothetical protein BPAE_0022g00020 [Botrytis paeoniae]
MVLDLLFIESIGDDQVTILPKEEVLLASDSMECGYNNLQSMAIHCFDKESLTHSPSSDEAVVSITRVRHLIPKLGTVGISSAIFSNGS